MADDLTAKIGAINAQLSKLGTEQLSFIQSIVDRLSQPFTFDRNLSSDLGVNLTPHEVLAIFTGDTERDTRERCVELGVTQIEEFWRARAKRLYRGFEGLREIAGISEAIAAIDRPVCVASNSSLFRLTRSLGRLPLWQEFNGHVFGADLVQRPKPAPDLLLLCASEMGVSAERAVMIDDSPHGIRAAMAAGMIPIGSVDPNDTRPGRKALLQECGAFFVAVGAGEIGSCLEQANALLRSKTSRQLERPRENRLPHGHVTVQ